MTLRDMKKRLERPAYEAIKKEATDIMVYQSAGINIAIAIVSGRYGLKPEEAIALYNDIKETF